MRSTNLALVALVALLLDGCVVGPDHRPPEMPRPERFGSADPSPGGVGATRFLDAGAAFWESFDDPLLTRLVEQALAANHDLRVALANVDRSRALLRELTLDRLPAVTLEAGAADARASVGQLPGTNRAGRDARSVDVSLVAGWELDLFGRIRRGIEAQRAESTASIADLQALQVVVVGELARGYFALRGRQARLRVAMRNAANQQETLRLVEARVRSGTGTDFDAARARAQLETTLSRVPALEAEVAVAMHRVAVLTGRMPESLTADFESPGVPPVLPARLDPGTPGDLLRRRPDVVAAEARLHAATARVGVATADLFPRFTLAGLIGTHAIDRGTLFERDGETRSASLAVGWPLFDLGRQRARLAAADADAAAELARYEHTVLLALEDTENALARYARTLREAEHLEHAARDSAAGARLARVRFDAGAASLLEALDAERTMLQAEDALADARARSGAGAVAVYQALAGGWPQRVPERTPPVR